MGLYVSHGCWTDSYSNFHKWRCALAEAAGMSPLEKMEGFVDDKNSLRHFVWPEEVSWDEYRKDPLTLLLDHSDCDGQIAHKDLQSLLDRLMELMPKLKDEYANRTWLFIVGLSKAGAAGQDVEFS